MNIDYLVFFCFEFKFFFFFFSLFDFLNNLLMEDVIITRLRNEWRRVEDAIE